MKFFCLVGSLLFTTFTVSVLAHDVDRTSKLAQKRTSQQKKTLYPPKNASHKELVNSQFLKSRLLQRLRKMASARKSTLFIPQFEQIIRYYENFSLDILEGIAREHKLPLYFVARKDFPKGFEAIYLNGKKADYYLWIFVNGLTKEEREKIIGDTIRENAKSGVKVTREQLIPLLPPIKTAKQQRDALFKKNKLDDQTNLKRLTKTGLLSRVKKPTKKKK